MDERNLPTASDISIHMHGTMENMMTFGQLLKQQSRLEDFAQGMEQGAQHGMQQEKRNTVVRMLEAGFSTEHIAVATELDSEEIAALTMHLHSFTVH